MLVTLPTLFYFPKTIINQEQVAEKKVLHYCRLDLKVILVITNRNLSLNAIIPV